MAHLPNGGAPLSAIHSVTAAEAAHINGGIAASEQSAPAARPELSPSLVVKDGGGLTAQNGGDAAPPKSSNDFTVNTQSLPEGGLEHLNFTEQPGKDFITQRVASINLAPTEPVTSESAPAGRRDSDGHGDGAMGSTESMHGGRRQRRGLGSA